MKLELARTKQPVLESTAAKVYFVHYTPEMEEARSWGDLRVNSFTRIRNISASRKPILDVQDLGDAEALLSTYVTRIAGSVLMKILLVEENSAVRRVLRNVLALPGTWIQECADMANAIAAYAAGRADVVVMDIGIKEPSGIAACEQIKAMDPGARIILVSDYDDAGLREGARDAGACGYVLKDNLVELPRLLRDFPQGS